MPHTGPMTTTTRLHYFSDNECGGARGNDSLALTVAEVNCSECITKMYDEGILVEASER